ncbi:hypothetical protein [Azospirillum sp. TSO5]|uniref:hypothetical protein n=1 Tax=Azospirillum sp. TSO5 TaxID=716760 RepID=UPI000D61BDD1|nr:hypothetical protein [Azospirillum sp. TSO5]PWC97715.1 hypothetical protein TSO5_04220 [Azospirillum sp. TSO5]
MSKEKIELLLAKMPDAAADPVGHADAMAEIAQLAADAEKSARSAHVQAVASADAILVGDEHILRTLGDFDAKFDNCDKRNEIVKRVAAAINADQDLVRDIYSIITGNRD